jgi:pyruvate dehydrogenase E1 component alpha subunit
MAYWTARDPIARFRAYMQQRGLWDEKKEKEWADEASRIVEEEVKRAEGYAPPTLDDAFAHTYGSMPKDLKEQLEFMRTDLPPKKEG